MKARDIKVGDTLRMATGDVVVVGRRESHGRVECVVRSARSPAGSRHTRILWFWPSQVAPVLPVSRREAGVGGLETAPGRSPTASQPRLAASESPEPSPAPPEAAP
jgi:hypothetical protein